MPWALNIWPRRPNMEGRDDQKFPKHVRVKPLTIEHPVVKTPKRKEPRPKSAYETMKAAQKAARKAQRKARRKRRNGHTHVMWPNPRVAYRPMLPCL
jgi:hypothetical protein